MSSDDEEYVMVQSPSSDIISLPSLSSSPSRSPTPPVQTVPHTIHDLDEGLLETILVTLSYISKPFAAHGDYSDLGFIRASHVCVRWRSFMLACPDLWTGHVFTFSNHQAVLTILERTKRRPLDIRLAFSSATRSMVDWYSSLCLKLLPRTRSLKLSSMYGAIPRADIHGLLHSIIAQGTPALESLDIGQLGLRAQDEILDIRLEFFAPNLRSLRLDGLFFPCLSPMLTILQLKLSRSWRPVNDVTDVIRSSADTLENILLDVVPDSHPFSFGQPRAVSREDIYIPNAKILAFRGHDAGLLYSLRVPPDTFASLSLTAPLGRVAEATDDVFLSRVRCILSTEWPCLVSLDTAHEPMRMSILSLPSGEDMPPDKAWTIAQHSVELSRRLFYDCMSYGSDLPAQTVYPGLFIEWNGQVALDQWGRRGGQQLSTLLNLIRFAIESGEGDLFQSVRCLDICIPDDLLGTEWEQLLKGFTAVNTLRMHIASSLLLATLACRTTTLLPNLTTLAVVLDETDGSKPHIEYHQSKLAARRLTSLVVAYMEAGRENIIEHVRLEGKSNSREFAEMMWEKLSAYVPLVEVKIE